MALLFIDHEPLVPTSPPRLANYSCYNYIRNCASEPHLTWVYIYTEIVLKMLKPSYAVLTTAPGIWGCQWTSFTSFWPWWTNSNWGGTPSWLSSSIGVPLSSASCSTERSHRETWSSAPDAANIESSVGCHSIEVIGALCQVNEATGDGVGVELQRREC